MAIWTAIEAQKATGGKLQGTATWAALSISIDSRTTRKGDLFIALRGTKTDGHDYIREAFVKGAAAVMVEKLPDNFPATAPVLLVDDCIAALTKLAEYRRAESKAKIIAVTGSVGKTSTKEMLNVVFSSLGLTHVSAGNNNNEIGLPLSLAKMPQDVDYAIFELGMNHTGELSALTKIVQPHVAIITNVEEVHTENFADGLAGVAAAKAEIFEGLCGASSVAIINRDSQFFDSLAHKARSCGAQKLITFGENFLSDVRLVEHSQSTAGNVVHCKFGFDEFFYHIAARGKHLSINSLAVLATVSAVGANVREAVSALSSFSAQKGRGQILPISFADGKILVIDESYNASPVSMRAALANFADMEIAGKKIAVLGDMLELGEKEIALHEALAEDVARSDIDLVFTVGKRARSLFAQLPVKMRGVALENKNEVVAELAKILANGDAVLLKGSNSVGLSSCIEELKATNKILQNATC